MERDERGRFVKQAKQQPAAVSPESVTPVGCAEKIDQVLEKLHSLALEGNVRASNLYLAYTAGKPVPATGAQATLTWKQAVEQVLNGDDSRSSAD